MTESAIRQNPFLTLLDRVSAMRPESSGHGVLKVQIPQVTAIDLVSMNAWEWRTAMGEWATDEAVDGLLTGTTRTGIQCLNGLELRGLLLFVAPDTTDTELRIL